MKAKLDLRQLRQLLRDARSALENLVTSGAERGKELVRRQAPGGARGTIGKAVASDLRLTSYPLEGRIVIDAPPARRGTSATLHLPGGGTKQITLRSAPAASKFNIAELALSGTGIYGPRGQVIKPRRSKVLLIGVDEAPADEAWIESAGRRFILRRSSRGMRPDDYPGRAASLLEMELDGLIERAFDGAGV